MSDNNAKQVRKEVRKAVVEIAQEFLSEATVAAVQGKALELTEQRLNNIEAFAKDSLKKQDERSKAIQGWIVREVQFNIANQLHNMVCTQEAFIEVFAEAGVQVPDLAAKIDAKKQEISKRRTEEAEARMSEQMGQAANSDGDNKTKTDEAQPAPAQETASVQA